LFPFSSVTYCPTELMGIPCTMLFPGHDITDFPWGEDRIAPEIRSDECVVQVQELPLENSAKNKPRIFSLGKSTGKRKHQPVLIPRWLCKTDYPLDPVKIRIR